jgi:hypothetical protein
MAVTVIIKEHSGNLFIQHICIDSHEYHTTRPYRCIEILLYLLMVRSIVPIEYNKVGLKHVSHSRTSR